MTNRICRVLAVGGLLLGLHAAAAQADLVTWEFTGEVTDIYDLHGLVDGLVEVGSPFTASMTFDAGIADATPDNAAIGDYRGAIVSLSGAVGPIGFSDAGGVGWIGILDRMNDYDYYGVAVQPLPTTYLDPRAGLSITLADSTGNAFQDDSLPVSPFGFDSGRFGLESAFGEARVRGDITSVVPEPGAIVLLLLGLGLIPLKPGRRCRGAFALAVAGQVGVQHSPSARRGQKKGEAR